MPSNSGQDTTPKLSICISTWNRAAFVGATLDTILPQLTAECELVVFNPASDDNTDEVLSDYARRFPRLRYIKGSSNQGMDRNFDHAVELARGEYCWLMADDDFFKPGAVETVLRAIRAPVSLVLVNVETRDFTMKHVRSPRWLSLASDRQYSSTQMDQLFADADDVLRYIGAYIVKRDIWMSRDKERYYATLWLFVGVIFQQPLPGGAAIIAEPQVSFRMGNSNSYGTQAGELLLSTWPQLVRSLCVSNNAIESVHSAEPWKHFWWLLLLRALGIYDLDGYKRWLRAHISSSLATGLPLLAAIVPEELANSVMKIYYRLRPRSSKLHYLRDRRFYRRNWGGKSRETDRSRESEVSA